MTRYFLGADVGATKTHVLIADETGQALGLGTGGPGNHQRVGYDGFRQALAEAAEQALARAKVAHDQIAGAGYGVAGYDWPSEREPTLKVIRSLGFSGPFEAMNDTPIGLIAGSEDGWGVAVVAGTGCNCWGWGRDHKRLGRVTGLGPQLGEAAGATDLVTRAIQAVAHQWIKRGPATRLTEAFLQYTGTPDLDTLLEELAEGRVTIDDRAAPLVFQVAAAGDRPAVEVIQWAGCELGELANAVIRQLELESLVFDVVLVGSLFKGGPLLIEPMRETVHALAPGARLVRLSAPPVIGAVLLGMERAGQEPTLAIRESLKRTAAEIAR
ncbi:MAG TPA: BadF/BadG/BcrA/BcrD ATPase family protein [Anaerolineales bacterium]|nr:BadF/BadG/BcrA/BcrD ATPase family protein [Anaerolineales bacterium]